MTYASVFFSSILFSLLCLVFGLEVSVWHVDIDKHRELVIRKTLYASTSVSMKFGNVTACNKIDPFKVSWYLRSSHCYNEVFDSPDSKFLKWFDQDEVKEDRTGFYSQGDICFQECSSLFTPKGYYDEFKPVLPLKGSHEGNNTKQAIPVPGKPAPGEVAKSWSNSPYVFMVKLQPVTHCDDSKGDRKTTEKIVSSDSHEFFPITMTIEMKGPREYASPVDWPLMMFFMVMCIVYVLFGVLWLFWLVCYWQDLLRIQFWIGAVIILGMLEKAVLYSEYQSVRYTGDCDQNAVIFGELLSALKRSLARVLVIIVSLGYGIVRPRLGTTVPRLVVVALLFLFFSSVEGVLRVKGGFNGTVAVIANLTLSLIDSCVICWIFISLSHTTQLLKLRRNEVKLSLYRHFTNTLIFSVLASVIFIMWMIRQFKFVDCQSGWRELWVADAFWRLLFSTILLVIMVLLRPSINSQRFSHSPLIDDEDDEAKEPMINEAFEGMKIRGPKSDAHASQALLSKEGSQGDDMKWVEDNIPTTVAIALPVMDKEEEFKTKMEMSKLD
ncbi:transmembrane protein 87A-like [Hoplias malabaricus]|uniref:transmembrane protein 87A-like n=1 Tax=Hoplias malabaricus TaxID=27720 RepID=UPI003461A218